MKKLTFVIAAFLTAGGILLAQDSSEMTTINGTLGLRGGRIVVTNDAATYYLPGIERFISFIDGLKAGAQVTVEGYVDKRELRKDETAKLVFPVKLTLGGKVYEVGPELAGGPDGAKHHFRPGRWR
ncbi:MAG: hypothetical protein LBG74_05410 [Spirochaetaceae bacterium]|jgi:hypothetical protein|nr:hypothetical protein [Spirochaetaceae bacterium]